MAMQNLDEQIYDRAGITSSDNFAVDQAMLDDLATQAVRVIIYRVKMYNRNKLSMFSDETAVTNGDGETYADLGGNIVLGCERIRGDYRYPCTEVPWNAFERAKNPNSINYRTKYDPIWSHKNGKLYILPEPSSSESGYVSHFKFVDIDVSAVSEVNATSGSKFPYELDPALITWVIMQIKFRMIDKLLVLAQDEWDNITTSGTTVTASQDFTSQTSFTFTHNVGSMPTIVILDTTGKEIGGVLTHNTANFNSVLVEFVVAQSGTVYATKTSSTSTDLSDFTNSLPSWAAPTVPSMPTVPTAGDLASLTNAIPTYADIDLSSMTLPTALSSTFGTIPAITAITSMITKDDLTKIDTVRIQNALDQAADFLYKYWNEDAGPAAQADVIGVDAFSKITSHDVALANEATKAANAFAQVGAQEVATEVAKLKNIETELKHVIADFNGQIQGYGLRYNGVISEYRANIERYIAGIRAIIDEYAQESESDIKKFTAEFNYLVQKYKAEIEADITVYRAEVEAVLGEYNALINAEAQEFAAKISKARAYLEGAQLRLQIGKSYVEQIQVLPNEIVLLSSQFENEIRLFCEVQPQTQDDRR